MSMQMQGCNLLYSYGLGWMDFGRPIMHVEIGFYFSDGLLVLETCVLWWEVITST